MNVDPWEAGRFARARLDAPPVTPVAPVAPVMPSEAWRRDERPARLHVQYASAFAPKRPSWLWEPRIPAGDLTLLVGRGGLGKSTLTADLAAQVSRGELGEWGRVLIASAEDSKEHTLVPRLMAANADLDQILFVDLGDELAHAVEAMREAIVQKQAQLLVLDPLNAYLGGSIDSHRDKDLRVALGPLADMAHSTGCAVLCVGHTNKARTGDAYSAVSGSIAYYNAARSVLLFAADPEADEHDDTARVLVHAKSNLGPLAPAQRARLVTAPVEIDGEPVEFSRVEWGENAPHLSTEDAIAGVDHDERTAVEDAAEWLGQQLADGPRLGRELKEEYKKKHGLQSARTLDRAARRLNIRRPRVVGQPSQWSLPNAVRTFAPSSQHPPDGITGVTGVTGATEGCAQPSCTAIAECFPPSGDGWCVEHVDWKDAA